MLLPLFPVTSVGVTAGASSGVIDNVAEIRDADGSVDRRGAVFNGINGTLNLRYESKSGNTLGLYTNARGQYFTRFDGEGSDTTGAVSTNGTARFRLGKFTTADIQASSTISQAIAARAGDATTLAQRLDPLVQNTTYTFSDAHATLYQELGQFYRLAFTVGATVTTILDAPPIELGDGLVLDRVGLDGLTERARVSLIRELDARSSGDVAVGYVHLSAPYSINSFAIPPRIAGPQENDQVTLDAGYTRALTDRWQSLSRLGVSATTPPRFDPDQRLDFFPILSQNFNFVDPRYFASVGASLTYSAVVPRLGTGPLFAANAALAGQPFMTRGWKDVVIALASSVTYSSTSGITGETFSLFGVAGTAELRYPVSRVLAAHLGYDFFFSHNDSTGAPESIVSLRNSLFIGLSGYWSNDGQVVPMNNRTIPR